MRVAKKKQNVFYSYHKARTGQRYRSSLVQISSICLAQKLSIIAFKIGIFEVVFGLLNDAGLRIRARRQVKCSARKAIFRRGDVNVNEGHGDILFAVCISKRNPRNGKIGGLRRDPLQVECKFLG